MDEEEEREGEREECGRVFCIFCNVLSKPKLVEPVSFDSIDYDRTKLSIICTSCKVKGRDVGVCLSAKKSPISTAMNGTEPADLAWMPC